MTSKILAAAYMLIPISLISMGVFFFKSWAVCGEEDSSAGCPATDIEMLALAISVALFVTSCISVIVLRRQQARLS